MPIKETKKSVSIEVFGKDGKAKGKMSLSAEIFAAKVNPVLMAQAVRVYMANQRSGTASTKTRGEVEGSTRKIYRQKGTGKARHGGIRAPLFVGGGIVFGPRTRDFSLKLPTKMKRAALFSALTQKLTEKKVIIADIEADIQGKTRDTYTILKNFKLGDNKKPPKILFVTGKTDPKIARSSRNIEGITLEKAQNLHTYEILNNHYILFLKDAIEVLQSTFLKS